MAQLPILLEERARLSYRNQVLYYLAHCGNSYAKTFTDNIETSLALIAAMPTIGKCHKRTARRTYRLYRNHRRCGIYYWHNDHEVRIIDLIFTNQAKPNY